jgi:hypothetical protein
MDRETSRILFLGSVGVIAIGYLLQFIMVATHGESPLSDNTLVVAWVVGVIAFFTGYIGAMIQMVRLNQWFWLLLLLGTLLILWIVAPILLAVYAFAGPTTPSAAPFDLLRDLRDLFSSRARVERVSPDALKGGVFLCYRRGDSGEICDRIYEHLVRRYGESQVFRDVDDIPVGAEFPVFIQARLRVCAACLVIIGPKWLTISSAAGQRRLDEPDDFVRLEIEGALRAGLAVIPVLVYGAGLPPVEALPESLGQLRFLNAAQVRLDPDFGTDIRRLCDGIDRVALRPTVV